MPCRLSGSASPAIPEDWVSEAFFRRPHLTVARELIGCRLVCGGASGRIVETESYGLEGDPACHTAFRRSARDFVAAKGPGALYIYLNYGVHYLVNLYARGGGDDGIILIRALEPVAGIEEMRHRRGREALRDLCSGPGKLVCALGIDPGLHGDTVLEPARTGLGLLPPEAPCEVVSDVRIGISKAVDFPWRFLAVPWNWASVPPRARGSGKGSRRRRRSVSLD